MKKIIILTIFIVVLFGCNQEKSKANEDNEAVIADSIAHPELKESLSNSQAFYNEETGDTVYVDFKIEYNEDSENKMFEKYFIVSSYSSYKNDDKLNEELIRWRELEPNSYVETYGPGATKKYYISLGKFKTQEEVVSVFQEFKTKYPKEDINYFSIVQ